MLRIDPEQMCIDGTHLHSKRSLLDPYKEYIQEFLECGFKPYQIFDKLKAFFRSTMSI